MMLFALFLSAFSLSKDFLSALKEEDIRMARHLISHGMTVTHPEYPFLKTSTGEYTGHDTEELNEEDRRMARHLSLEGYTVN
ncbi:putative SP-containing protein [Vairimorpha necatrix]|uniref:SP-containing protein n=1 Tax=Vairimorpha necatrix TaxID=6039 RepID=A0AAX4JFI9_9MICR